MHQKQMKNRTQVANEEEEEEEAEGAGEMKKWKPKDWLCPQITLICMRERKRERDRLIESDRESKSFSERKVDENED